LNDKLRRPVALPPPILRGRCSDDWLVALRWGRF